MNDEEKEGKAKKFDDEKLDWHSMPMFLLEPLVQVFEAGVKKYGRHNHLKPFDNGDVRLWNSAQRHLVDCQFDPLATDDETGCYTAAQVAFNTLVRLYHARQNKDLK